MIGRAQSAQELFRILRERPWSAPLPEWLEWTLAVFLGFSSWSLCATYQKQQVSTLIDGSAREKASGNRGTQPLPDTLAHQVAQHDRRL